jgi:hypothetical protein
VLARILTRALDISTSFDAHMTGRPEWLDFSTEHVDPDTGFTWFVDCLGATGVNQAEASSWTLQLQAVTAHSKHSPT